MSRLLSVGSSGPDVKAVQDVLNYHVRRGEPLAVDGKFGPKTNARVREFQTSNGLKADGIVGPNTESKLFQVHDVIVPLFIVPQLQLTLPRLGISDGTSSGIRPPRLIPPLQWPGSPTAIPPGPFILGRTFSLGQSSTSPLPDFSAPVNALGLKVTVPSRQDPVDPTVASRNAILELIDDLPVNSRFKAFLGKQVPDPVERFSPPSTGFSWGAAPLFNPLDPTGFGVKGNARYAVRITSGPQGAPNIVFAAWGDGQLFLNFESKQGQAKPRLEALGSVFLGVGGTF